MLLNLVDLRNFYVFFKVGGKKWCFSRKKKWKEYFVLILVKRIVKNFKIINWRVLEKKKNKIFIIIKFNGLLL